MNAFTVGDAGSVLGFERVIGSKASFTFFGILMAVALVMALLFRGRRKVAPDPNRNRYRPQRLSAEAYNKALGVLPPRRRCGCGRKGVYSTVTDLARFLGWSTSQPRRTPT